MGNKKSTTIQQEKKTLKCHSFMKKVMDIIDTIVTYTVIFMIIALVVIVVYINPKNKPIKWK